MSAFMLCISLSLVCYCASERFPPTTLSSVIVDGNVGSCPFAEVMNQARNSTKEGIREILRNRPYCPCGGPGEWRRIAHLDMSDPNQQCPTNLRVNTSTPVRGCVRTSSAPAGCDSAVFQNNNISYSRVCGRVRGYQKGAADAFYNYNNRNQRTLDSVYMTGISITHGAAGSRQHIWSFVSANSGVNSLNKCPCTNPNQNWPHQVPPFVRDDYFCDSGPNPADLYSYYPDNPLWDGEGCSSPSTCCQFNTPPWFCTTLPRSTTEDIELRSCYQGGFEDVLIDLVDIYVI